MAAPLHPNTKHGAYKARVRRCEACGAEYTAHRLTSRYCSNDCRTNFGPWSYPVASQSNTRIWRAERGD